MKKTYLVTKSQSDLELFKKLLPEKIVNDTSFATAPSRSSARSLARTLLAVKLRPLALVVDADTNDASSVRELRALLQELLHCASPGIESEVFLAVPEMESLFLQDRTFLEKLAARKFSDAEWKAAELKPRKFLCDVFGEESHISERLLGSLNEQTILKMQGHPLVSNLCKFLSSVADITD
ncbi:hypothetical protein QUF72_17745 [Desulfobacterales bacterium HSG2]|nr:hypothetical protein [Desulfobacterales bacterium HSG2]